MREWLHNTWKQTVRMQTLARKGSNAGRVELTDAVLTWTTCMSSFVALVTIGVAHYECMVCWCRFRSEAREPSHRSLMFTKQNKLHTNMRSSYLTFCLTSQQTDESIWSAWGLKCMKCVHYCNCFLKHKYLWTNWNRKAFQNVCRNVKTSMSYFWT